MHPTSMPRILARANKPFPGFPMRRLLSSPILASRPSFLSLPNFQSSRRFSFSQPFVAAPFSVTCLVDSETEESWYQSYLCQVNSENDESEYMSPAPSEEAPRTTLPLSTTFGVSFMVELDAKRSIIVDFGPSDQAFVQNTAVLGLLDAVGEASLAVITSPFHDHGGAVGCFTELALESLAPFDAPIYLSESAFQSLAPDSPHPNDFVVLDDFGRCLPISIDPETLIDSFESLELVTDSDYPSLLVPILDEDVFLVRFPSEEEECECGCTEDDTVLSSHSFDELGVVVKRKGGSVLISGCGRGGTVASTISSISDLWGEKFGIKYVVGGLHFAYADDPNDSTETFLAEIEMTPTPEFFLNHCTGVSGVVDLQEALGDESVSYFGCGQRLEISEKTGSILHGATAGFGHWAARKKVSKRDLKLMNKTRTQQTKAAKLADLVVRKQEKKAARAQVKIEATELRIQQKVEKKAEAESGKVAKKAERLEWKRVKKQIRAEAKSVRKSYRLESSRNGGGEQDTSLGGTGMGIDSFCFSASSRRNVMPWWWSESATPSYLYSYQ